MAAPVQRRKKLPSGVAAALAAAQQTPKTAADLKAFIEAARNARLMREMSRDFI